jgi:hypothetical protein
MNIAMIYEPCNPTIACELVCSRSDRAVTKTIAKIEESMPSNTPPSHVARSACHRDGPAISADLSSCGEFSEVELSKAVEAPCSDEDLIVDNAPVGIRRPGIDEPGMDEPGVDELVVDELCVDELCVDGLGVDGLGLGADLGLCKLGTDELCVDGLGADLDQCKLGTDELGVDELVVDELGVDKRSKKTFCIFGAVSSEPSS